MVSTRTNEASIRHRVLVVDDDPGSRELCVQLLLSEGFEVIQARDGREGVALALADPPDLILCDINMPILDGFGLALTLRRNQGTKGVPLVFISAETDPEIEQRATAVGAAGFLSKPFLPTALFAYVRTALENAARSPIGGHAV